MEHIDLYHYTEQFPEAFAEANTFDAFARSLDATKPGPGKLLQHIADKYPGQRDNAYLTIKNHGYTYNSLLLPEAKKASDIFESVALYPYETGCYRDQIQYHIAKAAFISSHRAPGFDYFGRLGASYIRNGKQYTSGGTEWLTAAKPTKTVIKAYGPAGTGEWDLSTFEAIQWDDGRILITVRACNGFGSRWLCILDAGETAMNMLSDHERGEIKHEQGEKDAAREEYSQ